MLLRLVPLTEEFQFSRVELTMVVVIVLFTLLLCEDSLRLNKPFLMLLGARPLITGLLFVVVSLISVITDHYDLTRSLPLLALCYEWLCFGNRPW